ncbi:MULTISPECIES: fatty acid oxidation complex subunit alpha FadJ [Vibrio]|uniref:enoyl-CoA hydratase n=2 Tax=Vibrio TaxID=662 RepID=A0A7X4RUN7_9VIBR|nr:MULTISPECIES: fatty acid oxidation complex subunit alpha FadJ [Vibrio]MBF8999874.1 fatty acid oxidation complex subunit alpha FadJ [Vibrio nitrifigilis]MZI93457.1 fatty acid oxidation complex subunit alpha FadJ [Vibrio eleionomae]
MASENRGFSLSIDNHSVAWLQIDLPNEAVNTLRAESVTRINEILTELQNQQQRIKGLIIYSAKPDNFIAGADINMIDRCQSVDEARQLAHTGQDVFNQLQSLTFPVVAAIHGSCLGGGLELALACDYRVVSDDDKTRLGFPEVMLGLLPGAGGTQRLPRLVGLIPALDLILTGRLLRAGKAKKLGLVDDVVPQDILLEVAQRWLEKKRPKKPLSSMFERMLTHSNFLRRLVFDKAAAKAFEKSRGNYPAIDAIFQVMRVGMQQGMKKGLHEEAKQFADLVMTKQSRALRHLYFANNILKKHYPSDGLVPIEKVQVVGGGLMGSGIAYVTATKAQVMTRIQDVSEQGVLSALQYSYTRLQDKRTKRHLTSRQVKQSLSRLSGDLSNATLPQADLVVEAVFEDLALKQHIVSQFDQFAPQQAIFATNTSSLPISQIAENSSRSENVIGLHYFSPVEKMPLVEVIPHKHTSSETVAKTVSFARRQGKTPIVVKDSAGFFVNRILAPYLNEAAQLMLDNQPIEEIDAALTNFGFPVGPLCLLDEVGLDIGAKVSPILVQELGDRFKGPDIFSVMLNDGRVGKKVRKGFYHYPVDKPKEVDRQVYRLFGLSPESYLTPKTVAMRCLLPMLNEAVRCLDEGVIAAPEDGDIGAVYGVGFPPFLGGPFHYMDGLGLVCISELMTRYADTYGPRFFPCEGIIQRAEQAKAFYD